MNDNFYLTESYREARRKAEIDIDNWPCDRDEWECEYPRCSCLKPFFKLQENDRTIALTLLCFALAVSTVAIWLGTYYYVGTTSP